MINLLNDFWNWAKVSPEQYAKEDSKDLEEFNYPNFNELINYAIFIIDKGECSPEEIEDALMIMALDNETEDILDYLTANCENDKLERFVKLGVISVQPNVRWQIAELLYRRKPTNYEKYLRQLSQDENDYVRKRAYNALCYLNLN